MSSVSRTLVVEGTTPSVPLSQRPQLSDRGAPRPQRATSRNPWLDPHGARETRSGPSQRNLEGAIASSKGPSKRSASAISPPFARCGVAPEVEHLTIDPFVRSRGGAGPLGCPPRRIPSEPPVALKCAGRRGAELAHAAETGGGHRSDSVSACASNVSGEAPKAGPPGRGRL